MLYTEYLEEATSIHNIERELELMFLYGDKIVSLSEHDVFDVVLDYLDNTTSYDKGVSYGNCIFDGVEMYDWDEMIYTHIKAHVHAYHNLEISVLLGRSKFIVNVTNKNNEVLIKYVIKNELTDPEKLFDIESCGGFLDEEIYDILELTINTVSEKIKDLYIDIRLNDISSDVGIYDDKYQLFVDHCTSYIENPDNFQITDIKVKSIKED